MLMSMNSDWGQVLAKRVGRAGGVGLHPAAGTAHGRLAEPSGPRPKEKSEIVFFPLIKHFRN
jgi:hypothetical protein